MSFTRDLTNRLRQMGSNMSAYLRDNLSKIHVSHGTPAPVPQTSGIQMPPLSQIVSTTQFSPIATHESHVLPNIPSSHNPVPVTSNATSGVSTCVSNMGEASAVPVSISTQTNTTCTYTASMVTSAIQSHPVPSCRPSVSSSSPPLPTPFSYGQTSSSDTITFNASQMAAVVGCLATMMRQQTSVPVADSNTHASHSTTSVGNVIESTLDRPVISLADESSPSACVPTSNSICGQQLPGVSQMSVTSSSDEVGPFCGIHCRIIRALARHDINSE